MKYDEGLNNFHKLKDYIKTSLSIKQNLQPDPLQDDEKNENEVGDTDEGSLSKNIKLEDLANTRIPKSSGNNVFHIYAQKHVLSSRNYHFKLLLPTLHTKSEILLLKHYD